MCVSLKHCILDYCGSLLLYTITRNPFMFDDFNINNTLATFLRDRRFPKFIIIIPKCMSLDGIIVGELRVREGVFLHNRK